MGCKLSFLSPKRRASETVNSSPTEAGPNFYLPFFNSPLLVTVGPVGLALGAAEKPENLLCADKPIPISLFSGATKV